jgi:hypothetical protein
MTSWREDGFAHKIGQEVAWLQWRSGQRFARFPADYPGHQLVFFGPGGQGRKVRLPLLKYTAI